MSLGINERVKYINIKDGKIILKEGEVERHYDYLEGSLEDITTPSRVYNGEEVKVWNFKLRDKSGEIYILSIGYNSGVALSLLNSLASTKEYSNIKIAPYIGGKYSKVSVFSNGERLKWRYDTLPPVELLEVKDGIKVRDNEKRLELLSNISKEILLSLHK